jgi:hypothetical protein
MRIEGGKDCARKERKEESVDKGLMSAVGIPPEEMSTSFESSSAHELR